MDAAKRQCMTVRQVCKNVTCYTDGRVLFPVHKFSGFQSISDLKDDRQYAYGLRKNNQYYTEIGKKA